MGEIHDWVLGALSALCDPADPWTTRTAVRAAARDSPYSEAAADTALDRLADRNEAVRWSGAVAPADRDVLRAIIEGEAEGGTPRRLLVARCNELLHATKGDEAGGDAADA